METTTNEYSKTTIVTNQEPEARNVQNIDQVNEQLKQRTLHFHQDGSSMEFTCVLSSHQEMKKNKDFENSTASSIEESAHSQNKLNHHERENITEGVPNSIKNTHLDPIPHSKMDNTESNLPCKIVIDQYPLDSNEFKKKSDENHSKCKSFYEPMEVDSHLNILGNSKISIYEQASEQQIEAEATDYLIKKVNIATMDKIENTNDKHVTENNQTGKKTASNIKSNVLYSIPANIKTGISKFNSSCDHHFGLTPTTSFVINTNCSPCTDDTQQLIHATVPKKTDSFKLDYFETMIDNIDRNAEEIADTTPIWMVEDNSIVTANNQEKDFKNVDECKVPVEIKETDLCSKSHQTPMENNTTEINDITPLNKTIEADSTFTNQNYTLRSQKILDNITKYVSVPFHDDENKKSYQKEMDELWKMFYKNNKRMEELNTKLFANIETVSLRDLFEEAVEESERRSVSLEPDYSDSEVSSLDVIAPKTLYERVCEGADRCGTQWTLNKSKTVEDCYHFTALEDAVTFRVDIHPELGLVYKVETHEKNLGDLGALDLYNVNILQHKMKENNLLSALGNKFEILTLLDYVSMTIEEILNFNKEFEELRDKYRKSHKFKMDCNFNVIFKILSVRYSIWWVITVKMSLFNIGCQEDISAVHEIGEKVNEDEIKIIAGSIVGGQKFLRTFIENVEEYKERIGRKIKYKTGIPLMKISCS